MKFKDVLKIIDKDGWFLVNQVGSHMQFKHPTKRGRITIAGKPNDDVPPKTLKSILNQAGLD